MTDQKGVTSVGGDWTSESRGPHVSNWNCYGNGEEKVGGAGSVFHNRMEEQESSDTDRQPIEEVC